MQLNIDKLYMSRQSKNKMVKSTRKIEIDRLLLSVMSNNRDEKNKLIHKKLIK